MSNIKKVNILTGEFLYIKYKDIKIRINSPTMSDYISGDDFFSFLAIINEKNLKISKIEFDTKLSYIHWLYQNTNVSDILNKYFKKFVPQLSFSKHSIRCKNMAITPSVFNKILNVILKCSGVIPLEKEEKPYEEMDEFEKRVYESEKKLEKLRRLKDDSNSFEIDKMMSVVIYNYKMNIKDVLELPISGFFWLYGVSRNANYYEMTRIAYANANIKELKHFIDL